MHLFRSVCFFLVGFTSSLLGDSPAKDFLLRTKEEIKAYAVKEIGTAWVVNKGNFPALDGITCFTLELYDESMRIPHWHPNAAELGYVISGTVEIIIWRSPGESAVYVIEEGMCWFIPQGALHCLNNIGSEKAELLVGFANDRPQDMDLAVALNGVPVPVRDAYTSPHADLKKYVGPTSNPLIGKFQPDRNLANQVTGSVYKIDLAQVTPLFSDPDVGSVTWVVKDNWSILDGMSLLRARLKPGVARDAIWYPDAGTLYVISKGKATFQIVEADRKPRSFVANQSDYVFVPVGLLHTFINYGPEDFEAIAFFSKANPLPEISLSVATAFFPPSIIKDGLTRYANAPPSKLDPLKSLNFTTVSPYLLKIPKAEVKE